ncbi:hypothetical protein FOZ76_00985 [Verticiella sediminum]|uniref:Uncharacterized protein n=1 Tax=Verticiella sediminum TaxID=1247510 RepID=A0A556B1A5_9BURK|nr:hypothetical protein [Verticiella sediminum]TSH98978.1 hypothetical protein FOZ76_00985 [Verticiella sediminum]
MPNLSRVSAIIFAGTNGKDLAIKEKASSTRSTWNPSIAGTFVIFPGREQYHIGEEPATIVPLLGNGEGCCNVMPGNSIRPPGSSEDAAMQQEPFVCIA